MEKLIVRLDFLEFPPTNTCDGDDESPRIRIENLKSVSLALMAVNPFIPSCCSFSPWLAWNIPPVSIIPPGLPKESAINVPIQAIQGTNDYGKVGYTGPCPPRGSTHRYTFKVWGLDQMLDLTPGVGKADLVSAMRGHVIQYGETSALCTR
ncbi:MAG: putative kinase inhibitor [Methanoregulaceae archaeon PtaB.Bin108]|nr:MAG: putative kinase inhibitor [Methanoregulaceae archaeon PtaB.Bin108]